MITKIRGRIAYSFQAKKKVGFFQALDAVKENERRQQRVGRWPKH
jgi:hypothetical protein